MSTLRPACLCFLLLCLLPGLAFSTVFHQSELSLPLNAAVMPDVGGMVNIHESLLVPGPLGVRGPVTLYPGWPLLIPGSSNRGGIYCNLDADPELELVILGHTHVPRFREVASGQWYVNTGDWVAHRTYLVLEEGEAPRLMDWEVEQP